MGTVSGAADKVELPRRNGEIWRATETHADREQSKAPTALRVGGSYRRRGEIARRLPASPIDKDLIVTAGGKKVAPQPIEARLKGFHYLAEAILVGDQRKYISAIVVPNFANLEAWARSQNIPYATRTELVQNKAVLRTFEEYMGRLNAIGAVRTHQRSVADRDSSNAGESAQQKSAAR